MSTDARAAMVAHHRVGLAGYVIDAATQKKISGAVVAIVDMPDAFRRKLRRSAAMGKTQTRDDGLYYFVDLPDGGYTLEASYPASGKRYGSTQQDVQVPVPQKPNSKFQFVNLVLQPTTIQGKITAKGQKNGVVLARVQIRGSGERTFSDENGNYTLSGIEPGMRTVQVDAQGYQLTSEDVQLAAGVASSKNFQLQK